LKEIEFIASHFREIEVSNLYKTDQIIIGRILYASRLKVKNEDWLYEEMWKFVEIDRHNFTLLSFIRFEFISTNVAHRFISPGVDFVDLIDSSIWLSLGRRFVELISVDQSIGRFVNSSQRFSPSGKSLDGIISYLTGKCGGNVHDNSLISVTVSGVTDHPKNAVDLRNRSTYFQSRDEPNSWICYDFKAMEVTSIHYSILSFPYGSSATYHPKS
jgi:hypothetical protein